ncbi:hypothetical protein SDC9_212677 [bioreactor metagenome]|uniref:Uncharacterized protein n=1 Tax=bioreactor metagenome TaxID=1076179 RepID=A0A645JQ94_9ZZZZ
MSEHIGSLPDSHPQLAAANAGALEKEIPVSLVRKIASRQINGVRDRDHRVFVTVAPGTTGGLGCGYIGVRQIQRSAIGFDSINNMYCWIATNAGPTQCNLRVDIGQHWHPADPQSRPVFQVALGRNAC